MQLYSIRNLYKICNLLFLDNIVVSFSFRTQNINLGKFKISTIGYNSFTFKFSDIVPGAVCLFVFGSFQFGLFVCAFVCFCFVLYFLSCHNEIEYLFIHIVIAHINRHFKIFVLFSSQLSCYFVFEVTDQSEKILLQVFPNCSASDELRVKNGNGTCNWTFN